MINKIQRLLSGGRERLSSNESNTIEHLLQEYFKENIYMYGEFKKKIKLFLILNAVFFVIACDGSNQSSNLNKIPGTYLTEYGPPIKNKWVMMDGVDNRINAKFKQAYSTLNDPRFPSIDVDVLIDCMDVSALGFSSPRVTLITMTDERRTPLKIKIISGNQVISEIGNPNKTKNKTPVKLWINGIPIENYKRNIKGKLFSRGFMDAYGVDYTSIPKTNLGPDDTNIIQQWLNLKDMQDKSLEIEIPTIAGSPKILIDTRSEIIKNVVRLCGDVESRGF